MNTSPLPKRGNPIVHLIRADAKKPATRSGFLAGQARIPANFDALHSEEIADAFEGTA